MPLCLGRSDLEQNILASSVFVWFFFYYYLPPALEHHFVFGRLASLPPHVLLQILGGIMLLFFFFYGDWSGALWWINMFDPLFLKKLRLTSFFVSSVAFVRLLVLVFRYHTGLGALSCLMMPSFRTSFTNCPWSQSLLKRGYLKFQELLLKNYWSTSYDSTQLAFCIEPSLIMASMSECVLNENATCPGNERVF